VKKTIYDAKKSAKKGSKMGQKMVFFRKKIL
jgi:hypothetical protein